MWANIFLSNTSAISIFLLLFASVECQEINEDNAAVNILEGLSNTNDALTDDDVNILENLGKV